MVTISHLLKEMSTDAYEKHGLLITDYRPYGNLISDKIKWEFFYAVIISVLLFGCTTCILTIFEEKARWQLHKDTAYCFEQILDASSHKKVSV